MLLDNVISISYMRNWGTAK